MIMSESTKIYANALAQAQSARLDGARLRRLIEAKTLADAFKMLGDYGFAYEAGATVDAFIIAETNRLIEFIEDAAASKKAADALTARFWYNNVKLAYKSRFTDVPSDGYYDIGDHAAVAHGDYSELGKSLETALTELDEAHEHSPQAIDLRLTRAMYEDVLACGIPSIRAYFKSEIDLKNILAAARMRRLSVRRDELVRGGYVPVTQIEEAMNAEGFADELQNTRYAELAERLDDNKFAELWSFELASDDYLYCLTDSAVAKMTSYTPFLNYYTQALIELKTLKTALVCIKTNARDMFYARIPELYKD